MMADCTALPSGVHSWLRDHGSAVFRSERGIILRRRDIAALGFQKSSVLKVSHGASYTGDIYHSGRNHTFRRLRSLSNPEGLNPQWVSLIDQLLLTVSIFLAYIGTVVPQNRRAFPTGKKKVEQITEGGDPNSSGRSIESIPTSNIGDLWSTIQDKLSDALRRAETESFETGITDHEEKISASSLSLLALAESPRLRLLWITFQILNNEVNSISQSQKGIGRDGWLSLSYQILWQINQQIPLQWFEGEISLKNSKMEMGPVANRISKLLDKGSVQESLKRMGKSELYADLLYFLRFDSQCDGHIFGSNFLTEHGVHILEDLVITLADGISSLYLELISIDSAVADDMNFLDLDLCILSTREIQRIRNEVALRQWVIQNFQSIASMYEDRIDLWVLQVKQQDRPITRESPWVDWWKSRLSYSRQETTLLCSLQISRSLVRVKRTKELRSLTGWRYYYSLFLELSDVAMPLARAIVSKGRDVISFLLTCMVGRSLGLIYTGIRQALGFR